MQGAPISRPAARGADRDPPDLMGQGQVKVIGSYPSTSIKDGESESTYYQVSAGRWLRLKAGGPVNLALKLRSPVAARKVVLQLKLDPRSVRLQDVVLSGAQSTVVYVRIPEGMHELGLLAPLKLLARPVKVKRDPGPDDWKIEWATGQIHPPAPPALGTSAIRPSSNPWPATAEPEAPLALPSAPRAPGVSAPASPANPEPPTEPLQVPSLTPPQDPTIPSGPDGVQRP